MYQYNKKRIISFLVFGAIAVAVSVGAIRVTAKYLSSTEESSSPPPTPFPPHPAQPTRQLKPQEVTFPAELLGLCQDDTDYDASFDINQDGCIRQNDWDLFGR